MRDFSALCVYSKFGHHAHPLGYYLCAKKLPNFVSFTASIDELAQEEKSRTQSITHSVTHSPNLFHALGTGVSVAEYSASRDVVRLGRSLMSMNCLVSSCQDLVITVTNDLSPSLYINDIVRKLVSVLT